MRRTLQFLLILWAASANAQLLPDRYRQTITDSVVVTRDVLFSSGVPQPNFGGGFYEFVSGLPVNADESDTDPVDLYMDIFEPFDDTLSTRPVIIIAFGGGFLSGTRDHWSMELIAREMAKRGYVAATMDYRLGMNIFDRDLAMRAVYRGIQDGRSAVRFFRADAATGNVYGIDPDHIYIGGHSAGAFVALHNLYLDQDIERPASTRQWWDSGTWLPDQGVLDGVGDNLGYSGLANGGFSLAGALGFTSLIEGGESRTSVLFHSTDDDTVPYDQGEPFESITFFVIGDDLPEVYGSESIADRCDSVMLDYQFYTYSSRGHDVHELSSTQLYSDILPGITDYIHSRYLEPDVLELLGDSLVCNVADTISYVALSTQAAYFDWEVTGDQWTAIDSSSNIAQLVWLPSAPDPVVSVTPYSQLLARGTTQALSITLSSVDTIELIQSGVLAWDDSTIWSQARIPEGCDNVVLPSQSSTTLAFPATLPAKHQRILSLQAGPQVQLQMMPGAMLSIRP